MYVSVESCFPPTSSEIQIATIVSEICEAKMTVSSVLGYSLFSASSFLFFLAFIFAVCGYFTPWLVPKEQYATEDQPQIESVGLKQVCFKDFRFSFHFDPRSRDVFDSCYDNQRNSAKFDNIAVDVWSPSKYTHMTIIVCDDHHV